jgi:hypothetical protein
MGQNVGVSEARFKSICAGERAANVDLTSIHTLTGTFHDVTGAPFSTQYAVELRDSETGRVLKLKPLDDDAHFSLEGLRFRNVNLLLVHVIGGQPKRTGFETPAHLQCGEGPTCNLAIVLKAGPTDDIRNQCPLI